MDTLNHLPDTSLFQQSESILAPAQEDHSFPCHPDLLQVKIKRQPDMLVRTVIHEDGISTNSEKILWHTRSMGRAGWKPEKIAARVDGTEKIFGGIFITSTGVAKNIDKEIAPNEIPFARPYLIVNPNHVVGAKTRKDCVLDAQNSIKASNRGVRTRLPYRGYYQNFIYKERGGYDSTIMLSNLGVLAFDSAPYASLSLMETPFRICDLTDILTNKTNVTDQTIIDLHTFFILELEYAKLQPDFNLRFPNTKMTDPDLSQKILVFIASRLGSLEKQMRKGHADQQVGHSQNYSVHGETTDNSTLIFDSETEDKLILEWEENQRPRINSNFMLTEFFEFTERLKMLPEFTNINSELIRFEFYSTAK